MSLEQLLGNDCNNKTKVVRLFYSTFKVNFPLNFIFIISRVVTETELNPNQSVIFV